MPKSFRSLLVLALIMTVSCLDATENDATTSMSSTITTTTMSTKSTTVRMTMTTIATEGNASTFATASTTVATPVTVTMQNDGISTNMSNASSSSPDVVWECPNITKAGVECSCDFPHTLRCTGDRTALQVIAST